MTAPNPLTNLLCTNVRGPETPLYCLGHKMVAHYPWVLTTWRMGLSVAVMSYMENLSLSFTGDAAVLPDIERLAEFTEAAFLELCDAVAVPRPDRAHSDGDGAAGTAPTPIAVMMSRIQEIPSGGAGVNKKTMP
jgi:hypothetical protein